MLTADEITPVLAWPYERSDLLLPNRMEGKVRDWYDLPQNRRLLITTDRLSAFDRNLSIVPYKGQVLNQLSAWWFENTQDIIPNHLLGIPDPNAAVVKKVAPFPVEVIVRGYITGVTETALWRRYELGERDIYGYRFKEGLQKNQQLPEPIITPTTKGGATGHDERLTCADVVSQGFLDAHKWECVQAAALNIFKRGAEIAHKAGMILVDTKYEFGLAEDGRILLIDEVHTPDSSRFWKEDSYAQRFSSGQEPENFDKEFIRRHYADLGYRGEGEPPQVDPDLWVKASQRYIEIYELLTGKPFVPAAFPVGQRLIENLKREGILA